MYINNDRILNLLKEYKETEKCLLRGRPIELQDKKFAPLT